MTSSSTSTIITKRAARRAPLATRAPVTPVTLAFLALLTAAASLGATRAAGAQILRGSKTTTPQLWVALSPGYLQTQSVNDGTTQSVWDFGGGLQWRGALEAGLAGGASFGVTGTYAHMPLAFYQGGLLGACNNGCDAHADIVGLGASFHAGGGQGLHQVIEASAGVTLYRNFTLDGGETATLPKDDKDLNLTVGYGFGYQVSPRFQIALVQDIGASWHQRENLPSNASTMVQAQTTRLSVRMGAGQRKAVR